MRTFYLGMGGFGKICKYDQHFGVFKVPFNIRWSLPEAQEILDEHFDIFLLQYQGNHL